MIKVESSGEEGENGSETHSEVCTAIDGSLQTQTTRAPATDNKRRRSQQQPRGQNRRHNMRQLTMVSVCNLCIPIFVITKIKRNKLYSTELGTN